MQGFTTGEPWLSVNPNYHEINARSQVEDADSVFHCYRRLIRLRKEYRVFAEGDFRMLLKEDAAIFAYTRNSREGQLLVVCNFYGKEADCAIREPWDSLELLACNYKEPLQLLPEGGISLRPYEARMYWKESGKACQ